MSFFASGLGVGKSTTSFFGLSRPSEEPKEKQNMSSFLKSSESTGFSFLSNKPSPPIQQESILEPISDVESIDDMEIGECFEDRQDPEEDNCRDRPGCPSNEIESTNHLSDGDNDAKELDREKYSVDVSKRPLEVSAHATDVADATSVKRLKMAPPKLFKPQLKVSTSPGRVAKPSEFTSNRFSRGGRV